jgi:hypothetical protein
LCFINAGLWLVLCQGSRNVAGVLRFDPVLRSNRGWLHQQNVEQALRRLGQIVGQLRQLPGDLYEIGL